MQALLAIKTTAKVTLASLAREIFADCEDVEITTDRLIKKLRADRALFRQLMADIVKDAVHVHASNSMRLDRQRILKRALIGRPHGRSDVAVLGKALRSSFLDFWVDSGLRLRHATHEQVATKAAQYDTTAKDTGHKARWLGLIAQSVPANKKVGEVLSEKRVAELWRETL